MDASRYPALGAIESLKAGSFDMGAALRDPGILRGAVENISSCVAGRPSREGQDVVGGRIYPKSAVLYAASLVLLSAAGSEPLSRRFALGESRRAEAALAGRMADAAEMIGAAASGGTYLVPVPAYLRRSVRIGEAAWKLVNRDVDSGMVRLAGADLRRLLRADLTDAVMSAIRGVRLDRGWEGDISGPASEVAAMAPRPARRPAAGSDGIPPCVEHAAAAMSRGENLNHSGRFLVASYMLRAGRSRGEVASLFSGAPDYSERVTAAQVAHIDGAGYSPQGCAKLEGMGLCRRDHSCRGIRNPLQYRRGGGR